MICHRTITFANSQHETNEWVQLKPVTKTKTHGSKEVNLLIITIVVNILERFSNDCRKTKTKAKQLLRPITTGAGSAMNQSQFLAITSNSLEARERSRVRGAIGFGFDSHCLKNWRESFKPITKRSNRNHVITFDSHLKTTLI